MTGAAIVFGVLFAAFAVIDSVIVVLRGRRRLSAARWPPRLFNRMSIVLALAMAALCFVRASAG